MAKVILLCIACKFYHQLVIKLVITNKLLSPMAVLVGENVGISLQRRDSTLVIIFFINRENIKLRNESI
ncbi:MAG: hypothetical protein IJH07_07520, partial [Ruminococcus sp.]|nr:hypothetical protein [Ruminococcus sp.]